jgi:DNA-binding response OmpR family regulator
VIVLTAMNRAQVVVDVAGKGVSDVVGKPFDLDILLMAINASLDLAGVPTPIAA